MDIPSEIELKLEVDATDLPRLRASPLIKGGGKKTERLISRYFDTPEKTLARAGYTLRVRATRGGNVQTIKREGGHAAGLFVRPEWEQPVDGEMPMLDRAGPLSYLVSAGELDVAFVSEIERETRHVALGGAQIEVALDEGQVRAGERASAICELELELKGGEAQPLFALAHELNALVPLRIEVRSKAERGHALTENADLAAAKSEPVMLDAEGDARDGFAAIAAACIRHFRLNEPLLLKTGEADALHQTRVALRRLRSAFSSFRPLLAGDPRALALSRELRWLAGELGEARDLDVLIPKLEAHRRARLEPARALALSQARSALKSLRARALMLDLAEWLAIGALRREPADPALAREPIAALAASLLRGHRKRLKRRGQNLSALDDHHRHRARIEAKKLRYATEFFASLWTEKKAKARLRRFLEALEDLQDQLGALNDQVAAARLLARHGIDGESRPKGRKKLLRKADKGVRSADAGEALLGLNQAKGWPVGSIAISAGSCATMSPSA